MARSMIYKEMKPFLFSKITQANLHKKTYRARKHLMLFGKNGVGIDKIKLVLYSTTEILKLTNTQIQNVINQVTSKTIFSENDQSHMPLKTTNGDVSSKFKVNVSTISRLPIPRTTYN